MRSYEAEESYKKQITIKIILCIVYIITAIILLTCSYKIFKSKYKPIPWEKIENTKQYAYIKASKMSEKFAIDKDKNISFHFVIEEEDNGLWHTYIVAIKENDYSKYKKLIDYTYERTTEEVDPIKLYGYPEIISDDLKKISIEKITKFIPTENEIIITNKNFETYLTNSFLNTTQETQEYFSGMLFLTLILSCVMIFLLIYTIIDKKNYN